MTSKGPFQPKAFYDSFCESYPLADLFPTSGKISII